MSDLILPAERLSDAHPPFDTVRPSADGRGLVILDQTRLPQKEVGVTLRTRAEMEEAIRLLRVRGAPLLGVMAAWCLAALARNRAARGMTDGPLQRAAIRDDARALAATRPTAINLEWSLRRVIAQVDATLAAAPGLDAAGLADRVRAEAEAIHAEDRQMCLRIGEHALRLLPAAPASLTILTHCNAGALATAGVGTALAPLYLAHAAGRTLQVFVDETRPLLQGARLTAWELHRAGIEVTVITDGMAGALLATIPVDAVIVGADRIAANGDTANKIGTYGLAVLARRHEVPFYVLAPTTTLDPATPDGDGIPIEQREPDEVSRGMGKPTVPEGVRSWNPAFDVTPAELVTAWVTDRGVRRSWT
jgi:methylthioribose-1-phosphate isomerase